MLKSEIIDSSSSLPLILHGTAWSSGRSGLGRQVGPWSCQEIVCRAPWSPHLGAGAVMEAGLDASPMLVHPAGLSLTRGISESGPPQ